MKCTCGLVKHSPSCPCWAETKQVQLVADLIKQGFSVDEVAEMLGTDAQQVKVLAEGSAS